MTPLALVTGFLGSGKTTLLRRLAARLRDRKIVYLVNEFSARDVDSGLLAGETDAVVSIPGGSIFCRCLITEFLARLRDLPERFGTPDSPVQGVVVEASGLADPSVAPALLREARLDSIYSHAATIAVVDPATFPKLLHTLPGIRAQIAAATLVVINKIDLHPDPILQAVERDIRQIQPGATILRAVQCDLPIDPFAPTANPRGVAAATPTPATHPDPRFITLDLPLEHDLDIERLRAAVAPVKAHLHRLKGFARRDGRWFHIDFSSSGWRVTEIPPSPHETPRASLVLIAAATGADAVRRIAHAARGGCFAPAPHPPHESPHA